ncbi:hypothetical protein [Candidatus Electronema sp. JC]|uniref:hypothetical protein n=1 Tax=Candidatus Electronema sp. JC TaxID=3401570 RepID=UPI003AA8E4A9
MQAQAMLLLSSSFLRKNVLADESAAVTQQLHRLLAESRAFAALYLPEHAHAAYSKRSSFFPVQSDELVFCAEKGFPFRSGNGNNQLLEQ